MCIENFRKFTEIFLIIVIMTIKRHLFCSVLFILFYTAALAQNIRPQTPVEPFLYKVENVEFFNIADSALLSGTITIPNGKGPFAAVVLITGSGSQNRDEEIFGHKPFMVIADYLTRNGVVVLRFDDRGIGKSTAGKGDITTQSNSRDVAAAIDFIKTRNEVNKSKIGLIGHSEGGAIAFSLAANRKDINFLVSLAGCGVTGDKILLSQQRIYFKAAGAPDNMVETALNNNKEYFKIVNNSNSNNLEFKKLLTDWLKEKSSMITQEQIDAQLKTLTLPWMYNFIKYDPYNDIKNVKIPVLAINGKKDTQVLSSINLPAIETALKEGGNTKYKIIEPNELNHLFQNCKTGMIDEYKEIEETFDLEILNILSNWILQQ